MFQTCARALHSHNPRDPINSQSSLPVKYIFIRRQLAAYMLQWVIADFPSGSIDAVARHVSFSQIICIKMSQQRVVWASKTVVPYGRWRSVGLRLRWVSSEEL